MTLLSGMTRPLSSTSTGTVPAACMSRNSGAALPGFFELQFERQPALGKHEAHLAGVRGEGEVVEDAHGEGLWHRARGANGERRKHLLFLKKKKQKDFYPSACTNIESIPDPLKAALGIKVFWFFSLEKDIAFLCLRPQCHLG